MRRWIGTVGALIGAGLLAACGMPDPLAIKTLNKTMPVDVAQLFSEQNGRTGCVDYRAADNSCASLIRAELRGDRLIAVETGAVRGLDGRLERVSLRTSSRIVEGFSCLLPRDLEAVDGAGGMGDFLMETSRLLITQYGGEVCARYFQAGDAYVITTRGSDGRPFPPGDTAFRFVDGTQKVRAQ